MLSQPSVEDYVILSRTLQVFAFVRMGADTIFSLLESLIYPYGCILFFYISPRSPVVLLYTFFFLSFVSFKHENSLHEQAILFIHCWAGRGRTGLIAACLLGLLYPDMTAEQALQRVDAYYRTRSPPIVAPGGKVASFAVDGTEAGVKGDRYRLSPDTEEQEEQVRLFFTKILKR